MIYEAVPENRPISQGDIFVSIPKADMSLAEMLVVRKGNGVEIEEAEWRQLATEGNGPASHPHRIILPVYATSGIVTSQSCDAARAESISLSEIVPMHEVLPDSARWKMKTWVSKITKQDTEGLRWFYLPADASFGFTERMGVDLRSVFQIRRADLESLLEHRKGRLTTVAYEHFREKLAQFYRRYPTNPWYPLNKDEFAEYCRSNQESISPYPWQE